MKFSIIAAADQKMGIGINNRLPWDLKADLKHFSDITVGNKNNAVIMGLNTWLSLPEKYRPLKNRLNIVLSKDKFNELPEGVLNFQSLDDALAFLDQKKADEAFIIGGGMLYGFSITHPLCYKIYLTEVEGTFDCDTFFPEIPEEFKKTVTGELNEENGIKFKFCVYQK